MSKTFFHLSKLFFVSPGFCDRPRCPFKKWTINIYLTLYVVYLRCFDNIGVLGVIWHLLIGFAPIEYVRDAWSYTYLSVNFTKHNHPVIQAKKAKGKRRGGEPKMGRTTVC